MDTEQTKIFVEKGVKSILRHQTEIHSLGRPINNKDEKKCKTNSGKKIKIILTWHVELVVSQYFDGLKKVEGTLSLEDNQLFSEGSNSKHSNTKHIQNRKVFKIRN